MENDPEGSNATPIVDVAGLDCFEDRVAVKGLVGFLPDEPVFYSYLSGREILELSAGMHGLDVSVAIKELSPLISRPGMVEAMDSFAEDYSRGMKKKLGLLLALIHSPTLLILDEPTNGLDVESTLIFFELMGELSRSGKTVVFSTHLMDQVERSCSHVAIIAEGSLVCSGKVDEIRGRDCNVPTNGCLPKGGNGMGLRKRNGSPEIHSAGRRRFGSGGTKGR